MTALTILAVGVLLIGIACVKDAFWPAVSTEKIMTELRQQRHM